jgi:hypothetical protein
MANHEENYRTVGGNHLYDGDKRMQAFWDHLDRHSVAIATLDEQVQTSFDDINVRFDDLTNRLKALKLWANMNPGRREACKYL